MSRNNDKLLNKMAVIVAFALLFLHETCNPKISFMGSSVDSLVFVSNLFSLFRINPESFSPVVVPQGFSGIVLRGSEFM